MKTTAAETTLGLVPAMEYSLPIGTRFTKLRGHVGGCMKLPLVLIVVALLAGCASTYKETAVSAASAKLSSSGTILVATPENGLYEGKTYAMSGQMTATAVKSAFARHNAAVAIVADCKDLACMRARSNDDIAYFVVPEILHWEDRATEWSGKKDKLSVKISVYGRGDTQPISSTVIDGKSKWMTFGGDHPQDLLAAPIERYVSSLY